MAPAEHVACAPAAWLQVEVVYAVQPGQVDVQRLQLPAGASVADALHASGLLQRHGLPHDGVNVGVNIGVWGRLQPPTHLLRDRDRVEIYRPLQVDPKEARRLRYKQHRERVAGAAPAVKR